MIISHRITTTIRTLFIVAFFTATGGWAAALPLFAITPPVAETPLCLRYRFQKGDSLVYAIQATDTIALGGRPTIYRKRKELISVVCDYVDAQGRMYVRQTLEHYQGTEHSTIEKGDTRTTSAWIGRSAYLILDSTGNRVVARQADTVHAALAPGGAFQPIFLLPFGDTSCHNIQKGQQTWIRGQVTDTLAENGYPYPLLRQSINYLIRGRKDTINNKTYHITYGATGQASVKVINTDAGVYMRSVVNSGGDIYHAERGIPIAGNIGIHNRIVISMKDKADTEGTTLSYVDYRLIYPPPPVQPSPQKKGKKNPRTKK